MTTIEVIKNFNECKEKLKKEVIETYFGWLMRLLKRICK